ncbi:PAP2 superfamily protein [Ensifer adhaerens]|nr:PAP2 superfamily protein [Ensifer adhaerens]
MLATEFFKADTKERFPRRQRNETEPRWWMFITPAAIYTVGAAVLYPDVFWHIVAVTLAQMLAFSLAYIVLGFCAESLLKRPDRPLEGILEKLRHKGAFIASGLAMFLLGLSAYTTYKVNIPDVVPYYADPFLADLDRLVFGQNAWRVAHDAPEEIGLIINFFYTRVWPGVLLFGVLSGLLFMQGRALYRYAWGLLFVYAVIGTLLATIFASVGPIFYPEFYPHAPEFTHLKPALLSNPYISDISVYADYLLDAYRSKQLAFAAGISAFPSVHVAVATLSAWFLTGFGRKWAVLGWSQALIIQYGSIYSGWHYAVDGDVSLILVSLFWILLSRILGLPLMPAAAVRTAAPQGHVPT